MSAHLVAFNNDKRVFIDYIFLSFYLFIATLLYSHFVIYLKVGMGLEALCPDHLNVNCVPVKTSARVCACAIIDKRQLIGDW